MGSSGNGSIPWFSVLTVVDYTALNFVVLKHCAFPQTTLDYPPPSGPDKCWRIIEAGGESRVIKLQTFDGFDGG